MNDKIISLLNKHSSKDSDINLIYCRALIKSTINEKLSYEEIVASFKREENSANKCIEFYHDYDRGGFILDRFLHNYSSYTIHHPS